MATWYDGYISSLVNPELMTALTPWQNALSSMNRKLSPTGAPWKGEHEKAMTRTAMYRASVVVPVSSTCNGLRQLTQDACTYQDASSIILIFLVHIFWRINTTNFTPYQFPSAIRKKTEPTPIYEEDIVPVILGPMVMQIEPLQTGATVNSRKSYTR